MCDAEFAFAALHPNLFAYAVVNDLLHIFMGLKGQYICPHFVRQAQDPDEQIVFAFAKDGPILPTVREMAERLLPLGCVVT